MVNIPTSYFGLLECFSCGAWFTKSGKFDHVWIPWDIFRPYGFMCSIPSHKKNETFVYSLLSKLLRFDGIPKSLPVRTGVDGYRWRFLIGDVWNGFLANYLDAVLRQRCGHHAGWDDVLWSLHLIVSLLLNTYRHPTFDHLVQIPVTTIHEGDMFAATRVWSDLVILPRYL